MERILVGVDGSAPSRAALAWAFQLGRRAGLDVYVAMVEQGRHDHLAVLADGPVAGHLVLGGDPAEALLGAARDHDVDLLVIGRPRGREGEILRYGGVGQRLAHNTDVPLAVVPVWEYRQPVSRVVVGTDGSEGSVGAVELSATLAARLGVGVTAVYAVEPLLEWLSVGDRRTLREEVEGDVRLWAEIVDRAGRQLEVVVDPEIRPATAIGRAVAAHRGSVAVVGLHRKHRAQGHRPGRIPMSLIRDGDGPVIMVPTAMRPVTVPA